VAVGSIGEGVMVFHGKGQFEDAVVAAVQPAGFDAATARAIARVMAHEPEFRERIDVSETRAISERLGFAIRNDDLDLLKMVGEVLQACLTAGFIGSATPGPASVPAAVATIFLTMWRLLRSVVRKGARLDRRDCMVLCALKGSGRSLRRDELLALLSSAKPPFSEAELDAALARLAKVRLGSGEVVSLVAEDGRLGFSAAGV
jgi:hypothetical protein